MEQSISQSTAEQTQSVFETSEVVEEANEQANEMQPLVSDGNQQGNSQQSEMGRNSSDNVIQNQGVQAFCQRFFNAQEKVLQGYEDSSFDSKSQHNVNLDSSIESKEGVKKQIFEMDIDLSGLYSAFFSSDLVEYKYKEALANALKALKYNKENNQQKSFENVNILFKIGQIFLNTSQFKNSLEYFKKAERIYQQLFSHEYHFGAGLYNKFSLCRFHLSQFNTAKEKIKLATKCIEMLKGKEQNQKKAQNLYALGVISYDKFNNRQGLKNSLKYFHESLNLYKLIDGSDKNGECFKIYNAIGGIHFYRQEYEESGKYYEKTLNIGKHIYKGENQFPLAKITSNFATVLVKLGDLPRAKHYLQEANEIFKNLKIEGQLQNAGLLFNFCNLHEMKGDYTLALKYCEQSEKILLSLVDQKNIYMTEARSKLKILRQKISQQQQSSLMNNSSLNTIVSMTKLSVSSQN